jgi:beta-N-acetylhexosaminidase
VTARPTLAQLVGQKLVVRMSGTTPSPALLLRIGRGEIGGVILFGWNVTTKDALVALTSKLQQAAADGGQPPLLIATDQEGGSVKRIPWAPPTLSAPEMGEIGLASTARDQGAHTGAALVGLGINCDLAPVADVPNSDQSFMYLDGRTWSFSASLTATLSNAFARGLESAGVVPVMKHFPGLGLALENTDSSVVVLDATRAELAPGLEPYDKAIAGHLPMIMLSNATYAAYDPDHAAGWSHAISQTLLRGSLGFTGVTITDSLSGTAKARGVASSELAIQAALAGTDMLLVTGTEATTSAVYDALLAAVRAGTIPRSTLAASYARIVALKRGL